MKWSEITQEVTPRSRNSANLYQLLDWGILVSLYIIKLLSSLVDSLSFTNDSCYFKSMDCNKVRLNTPWSHLGTQIRLLISYIIGFKFVMRRAAFLRGFVPVWGCRRDIWSSAVSRGAWSCRHSSVNQPGHACPCLSTHYCHHTRTPRTRHNSYNLHSCVRPSASIFTIKSQYSFLYTVMQLSNQSNQERLILTWQDFILSQIILTFGMYQSNKLKGSTQHIVCYSMC